jgi:MYXO-CTERM domain-containing protein
MKITTAMALVAAVFAGQAQAAMAPPATTVLVDFDTITQNARVNGFYRGLADGQGRIGIDLGIDFIGFVSAAGDGASSPPGFAYTPTGLGIVDVAAGFTGFDFAYGTLAPATVSVWSELGGGGALLGSVVVDGSLAAFAQASVPFAGLGHSVTMVARPSYAAFDDLRFSTAVSAVPEASGWAMLALGACAIGGLQRRRPETFR